MHVNIPYIFVYWAYPVVHFLILTRSMVNTVFVGIRVGENGRFDRRPMIGTTMAVPSVRLYGNTLISKVCPL